MTDKHIAIDKVNTGLNTPWYELEPKEVVTRMYWFRGQIPPRDWEKEWPKIKEQLERKDGQF